MSPAPTADDGGRDPATGRFLPGNQAGRGNPVHRRVAAMRQELLDALEPNLPAVARAIVQAARGGDVQAGRLVLERGLGAVRQEPQEPPAVELGPLATVEDVAAATGRVVRAMACGEVDAEQGKTLLDALAVHGRACEAIVVRDLQDRLERLESAGGSL